MFMKQEPKYNVNSAFQIVNRATGKPIPDDEPVMIFRAKDALAAEHALSPYWEACVALGLTQHATMARMRLDDFLRFAADHPERMRLPSDEPNQTKLPVPVFEALDRGYLYQLTGGAIVNFVRPMPDGSLQAGTTTEELLAVLLDRVAAQNDQVFSAENTHIMSHLTQALQHQRARMKAADGLRATAIQAHDDITKDMPGAVQRLGIWMIPVPKSQNIEAFGYRYADNKLAVQYRGGRVYHYANVPSSKYEGLLSAESKGSYIAREITAGQFEGVRQEEPETAS